jgi:hypothetical protein
LGRVAEELGVLVDIHGLAIVEGADDRVVVVDEVEDGIVRLGLYASASECDALELVETGDPVEAVAIVRRWGVV